MQEAQKRDAVKRSKFWFRNDIITQISPPEAARCVEATGCASLALTAKDLAESSPDESCALMTVDEIINGRDTEFPGLVPLLRQYLLSAELDADTHCTILQYLNLIAGRASGKYSTTAQWIRDFVLSHPEYKKDSVVNERVNYDLTVLIGKITKGEVVIKELVGDNPATMAKMSSNVLLTSNSVNP